MEASTTSIFDTTTYTVRMLEDGPQESHVNMLLDTCVARLSVTVLALSKKNSNAIEILTFLHKLADVSASSLM